MDVAGTCSYKETRDIIVSTLELKFKITNNFDRFTSQSTNPKPLFQKQPPGHRPIYPPFVISDSASMLLSNCPSLSSSTHSSTSSSTPEETRLNVPFEASLCFCPAYSHGHITPVPHQGRHSTRSRTERRDSCTVSFTPESRYRTDICTAMSPTPGARAIPDSRVWLPLSTPGVGTRSNTPPIRMCGGLLTSPKRLRSRPSIGTKPPRTIKVGCDLVNLSDLIGWQLTTF